jgi:hypothetical protein
MLGSKVSVVLSAVKSSGPEIRIFVTGFLNLEYQSAGVNYTQGPLKGPLSYTVKNGNTPRSITQELSYNTPPLP